VNNSNDIEPFSRTTPVSQCQKETCFFWILNGPFGCWNYPAHAVACLLSHLSPGTDRYSLQPGQAQAE